MGILNLYSLLVEKFQKFLFQLGLKLEAHPWIFMTIGLFLTIIGSIGFVWIDFELRFLYMAVPESSDVWEKYMHIEDVFGKPPAKLNLLATVKDDNDNYNVLTPDNMDTAYDIFQTVYAVDNYASVCLEYPISNVSSVCLSDLKSAFALILQGNPAIWQDETSLMMYVNAYGPITPLYFGGFEYDNNSLIESASMVNIMYEVKSFESGDPDDAVYTFMDDWNTYWGKHKNDYSGLNIEYMNDRTLDDEIWRMIFGDIHLFVIAFVMMISYFIFALGKLNRVEARMWLALSIGAVLICSLLTAFGIGFMFGIKISVPVMLIPYVLLGVGVDDIVIIVHSYDEEKKKREDGENVLAHSLKESGLAITLTSFSSCMALLVGSLMPGGPPAINTFCLLGFLSFLAKYCMQFLIFIPLLLLDEKRRANKGNFCLCLCGVKHDDFEPTDDKEFEDGEQTSNADLLFSKMMVNIMSNTFIRWLLITFFISMAVLCIAHFKDIDTKSDISILVPDDSPIIPYLDTITDAYNDNLLVELDFIILDTDFSDITARSNILSAINDVQQHSQYIYQQNWLETYILWLNTSLNLNVDTLSSSDFYTYLSLFDTTDSADIVLGSNTVIGSKFHIYAFQVSDTVEQYDEYLDWNTDIIKNNNLNGYIYTAGYGFSFISTVIGELTVESMILAAIGVFIILSAVMDIRMAIFVISIIVLIDIDLFGCLYLFGFSLNIITYCILVMSSGLTVDYVIHISQAIMTAKNSNNNKEEIEFDKVLSIAMKSMGVSVLKGAFTSLLGGLPLLFSISEGFRIFGAMWICIIFVAVLHGFFLVPAILYEIFLCKKKYQNSHSSLQSPSNITSDKYVDNQHANDVDLDVKI